MIATIVVIAVLAVLVGLVMAARAARRRRVVCVFCRAPVSPREASIVAINEEAVRNLTGGAPAVGPAALDALREPRWLSHDECLQEAGRARS